MSAPHSVISSCRNHLAA
jgi:hypothetical protein